MTSLDDAHNHLHDERLSALRPEFDAIARRIPVRHSVVNGTSESDWQEVSNLAAAHDWIIPSFGLHPWHVKTRSADWLETLESFLTRHTTSAIGEIGLDRWIEHPDIDAQTECFLAQLDLARRLKRPCTIHCLKAWGLLDEILHRVDPPPCGFLLHSYGGSREMISRFAKLGAYFSISPYFAHERKAAQRDNFRHMAIDRLLIETDAPDMWPPEALNPNPLADDKSGSINHPSNLTVSLGLLMKERALGEHELREQLRENFSRLFLRISTP